MVKRIFNKVISFYRKVLSKCMLYYWIRHLFEIDINLKVKNVFIIVTYVFYITPLLKQAHYIYQDNLMEIDKGKFSICV